MKEETRIETFDGKTIEGLMTLHERDLPKSAFLQFYTYSKDYQKTYSVYATHGKKGTKIFIVRKT